MFRNHLAAFFSYYKKTLMLLAIVAFVCMCRVLPHVANFSPMVCVALFAGVFLSKRMACVLVLLSLFFSDLLLHVMMGYPLFGSWTLFTYSGFLAIMFLGGRFGGVLWPLLGSCVGFWVWTNFGVWLASGLYPLTLKGLAQCYWMAIPFLKQTILSSILWGALFWMGFRVIAKMSFIPGPMNQN